MYFYLITVRNSLCSFKKNKINVKLNIIHLEIFLMKVTTRKTDRICINISTFFHIIIRRVKTLQSKTHKKKDIQVIKMEMKVHGQLKC